MRDDPPHRARGFILVTFALKMKRFIEQGDSSR